MILKLYKERSCLYITMGALGCTKDAITPCREACPAGVNIPRYIRFIGEGKFAEALAVVRESIPFPAVCGYSCVHPCETNCARAQYDQPVAIRMLKRAAVEKGGDLWKQNLSTKTPTGKKVAVIGAGPGGLTAAYYLAGKGHQVVVLEALPVAGGMMRYCIPEYRLPGDVLDKEIAEIEARGVEIRTNTKVDAVAGLLQEGYDAVLVATGAWRGMQIGALAENMQVVDGISFLKDLNSGGKVEIGDQVVVIGGGNTAIDAARAAVRLGAKEVMIVYRRTESEMPANPGEVTDALEEGVKIEFLAAPVQISGNEITCQRMKLGAKDASGRPSPVPIEGSEFTFKCDTVIAAVGQAADAGALGLTANADGTVQVAADSQATDQPGVFAAGDVVTGPSSIIQVIAQGKRTAAAIDQFLGGDGVIDENLLSVADPVPGDYLPMGTKRAFTRTIKFGRRLDSFAAVEESFSKTVATREARRCLGCDIREYKVEIDFAACKECGYCREVCGLGVFKPAEDFNDRGYRPMQATDIHKCVGCNKCFFVCPDWAISVEKVGEVR